MFALSVVSAAAVWFQLGGPVMGGVRVAVTGCVGKVCWLVPLMLVVVGWRNLRDPVRNGPAGRHVDGWSALGLLFLVAELMVTIGIIQPRVNAAMQEVFHAMPNGDPGAAMMQAMQGSQSAVTVVINLVLYAPFPILLLILCGRRSATADFVD